jgi:hypothetical protein
VISALLLAVVVVGQSGDIPALRIDVDYVPKANDKALLGNWSFESPENMVERAWCYSSVEHARSAVVAMNEILRTDGLSEKPDAYMPRAGTPVVVKEIITVEVEMGRFRPKISFVKFRILEGEFKGKELLSAPRNIFRYVGGEVHAEPERLVTKKRTGRRGAPATVPADAKLVLTDLAVNPSASGNYVNVDGRFRCMSDTPLQSVRATISFEDREGKLVRSEDVFCTPNVLNSGDIGSFTTTAQSDVRYARVKLNFKDSQRNISWVDQSGMNAHQ